MAFSDYSSTAANNTSIGGTDISENCSPAGLNDAIRQLMADAKTFSDNAPSSDTFVKKDGTVAFTGQPTFSGRGAFLHHNNSANASGKIFIQASGGATPSMSNGDILLEY